MSKDCGKRELESHGSTGQDGAVTKTSEASRRWSGYVCPDCRFVFRVARDHDGSGVVCPGCRRLLRIPAGDERVQPLVVPPEQENGGVNDAVPKVGARSRRKKRRGSRHGDPAWEQETKGARSQGARHNLWLLSGGVGLFIFAVGVVILALRKQENTPPPIALGAGKSTPTIEPQINTGEPDGFMTDAEFLLAAEPMARKFLNATAIDDVLPLVRNPDQVERRLRAVHPDGRIEAPGMSEFHTRAVSHSGRIFSIQVRTGDFEERALSFVAMPEGLKIDWESWAGWSEMTWDDFRKTKPVEPRIFRVKLSRVDYYNMEFADDKKWRSYRVEPPNGGEPVFGYVERSSPLDLKLEPPSELRYVPVMLALKYPPKAAVVNQVLIDAHVADGWVEDAKQ